MKSILLLSTTVLFSFFASAQNEAADRKEIESQADAFLTSWNKHDFSDMKNYMTADADWVNVVGMWWRGIGQVQFAHQAFHKTMFAQVRLSKVSVDIRFVTKDVAVVHWETRADGYTTPSGQQVPAGNNMALIVFVRRDGRWLMTAAENVNINEQARAADPVKRMSR